MGRKKYRQSHWLIATVRSCQVNINKSLSSWNRAYYLTGAQYYPQEWFPSPLFSAALEACIVSIESWGSEASFGFQLFLFFLAKSFTELYKFPYEAEPSPLHAPKSTSTISLEKTSLCVACQADIGKYP